MRLWPPEIWPLLLQVHILEDSPRCWCSFSSWKDYFFSFLSIVFKVMFFFYISLAFLLWFFFPFPFSFLLPFFCPTSSLEAIVRRVLRFPAGFHHSVVSSDFCRILGSQWIKQYCCHDISFLYSCIIFSLLIFISVFLSCLFCFL